MFGTYPSSYGRAACLIAALAVGYGLQLWAATVSAYTFGRYEIVLQEGMPVAVGMPRRMLVTSARVPSLPEVNVNGRRGSPALVVGGRNC